MCKQMESRVKTRLSGHAKITNIAVYKRKKLFQRNKMWLIVIGIVVMACTAIYLGDEIVLQNANGQNVNSNTNSSASVFPQ